MRTEAHELPFRLALATLRRLLSPPECAACEARLGAPAVFCSPCAQTVSRSDCDRSVVAYAQYGGAVAEALRRFKYGDRSDLARPLGGLLRRGIEGNAPGSVDAVVPVPLHRRRLVERGYNQSALLAREVSDALRIPVLHALSRGRDTPQQALLDAVARRENVRDAFALARGQNVHGRRVLLVDDVATTGATLGECRRVLLEGGAAAVIAAVVAIAER